MSKRHHQPKFVLEKYPNSQLFKAHRSSSDREEPDLDQTLPMISKSPYSDKQRSSQLLPRSSVQSQLFNSSNYGAEYPPYFNTPAFNMHTSPYAGTQNAHYQPYSMPFHPSQKPMPYLQTSHSMNSIRMNSRNPRSLNYLYYPNHAPMQQRMFVRDYAYPEMAQFNPLQHNMMLTNALRAQMAMQAQQQHIISKMREQQRRYQAESENKEAFDRIAKKFEEHSEILYEIAEGIGNGPRFNTGISIKRKQNIEKEDTKQVRNKVSARKKRDQPKSSSDETEEVIDKRKNEKSPLQSRQTNQMNITGGSSQPAPIKRISAFSEILDYDIETQAQRIQLPQSRRQYPVSLGTLTPTYISKKQRPVPQENYATKTSIRSESNSEIEEEASLLSNSDLEENFNDIEKEKYPSIHDDLLEDQPEEEPEHQTEKSEPQLEKTPQIRPDSGTARVKLFAYSRKKSGKNIPPLSLPSLTKLGKDDEQISNRSGGFATEMKSRSTIFDDIKSRNNGESAKKRTLILPPLNLSAIRKPTTPAIEEENANNEKSGENNSKEPENNQLPDMNTLVFTEENPQLEKRDFEAVFENITDRENKNTEIQRAETEKQEETVEEEKPRLFDLKSNKKKRKSSKKKSISLKKGRSSKGLQDGSNTRVLIPKDEELKKIWHMFPVSNEIMPIQAVRKVRVPRRPSIVTEEVLPEITEETKQVEELPVEEEHKDQEEELNDKEEDNEREEDKERESFEGEDQEEKVPDLIAFAQDTEEEAIVVTDQKDDPAPIENPNEELPSMQEPITYGEIKRINLEKNDDDMDNSMMSPLLSSRPNEQEPEKNPSNDHNSEVNVSNSAIKSVRLAHNVPKRGIFSYIKNKNLQD